MSDREDRAAQSNPGARRAADATRWPTLTWPPAQPFAAVLDRARALDASAISLLYARFLPVVYRFALARVGDTHRAEDITSDTFFAMVEHIAETRARDELAFAAWLLGIARNKTLMLYRAHARSTTEYSLSDDAPVFAQAEEGDPLAVITARERWSEVVMALNKLTEEQRTVVLYRCVLGYETDAVAAMMHKSSGTIRALQFRALASLARHLDALPPDSATAPRRAPFASERRSRHGSTDGA